jgi:hypothetical protein
MASFMAAYPQEKSTYELKKYEEQFGVNESTYWLDI